MIRRLLPLAVVAAVLALAVSACGVSISDDGPPMQQNRKTGEFDRLEVHGSADVVVRPGRGGVVTVRGGRNRVRDTITRVESGTLFVEGRDSSGTIELGGGHVTVVVRTPSLAAARVDGSGDVTLAALRGRRLEVEVNGSADVRAAGRVAALDAEVDGSGDLHLEDLAAGSARLEIAGSGDADVDAERRLDVTLSGSGDVHYAGDPRLSEDVSGSGEISRD
jgi:hypothetical protein